MLGGVPRVIAVVFLVAVVVYACIVAIRMDPRRRLAGINKWVWVIFTLIPPVIGSIIFLTVYYMSNPPGPSPRQAQPRPSGPIAPDDDPEFLAKLDDEVRRAHYDRKLRDHEQDDEPGSAS